MNYAAAHVASPICYFLHADSRPPQGFARHIVDSVASGWSSGCFRLAFDDPHWFLRANAWFTRFDIDAFRFGDQSLFVETAVFRQSGGFRADLIVMEDQEIVIRLRRWGKFRVLADCVTTSARRYQANGIFRTQFVFACICCLYWLGCPQRHLVSLHHYGLRKGSGAKAS